MNVSYMLRRIGQAALVFLAVITITFALYRLMPGGPIENMRASLLQEAARGGEVSSGEIERINQLIEVYSGIRPDQPWYVAYYEYLKDIILHLDFGESIYKDEKVFDLLFARMPWSMFISIYGLALGTSVSLLLGALMAHYEGTWWDAGLTMLTIVNQAIPYFIVAILLIIIFVFNFEWFPNGGRYAFNDVTPGANLPFIISVIKHATLPILAGFIAGFGGGLAYRGNCIREKGATYTRLARVRGISENRIAIRYIGRNSLLPIYTRMMMGLAGMFSSSIILETIFNYRAVGLIMFDALTQRDYPLLMGGFIFFTAMTLFGLFIADMTYGIIDPRVEGGGERETY
jgi:peptide/nickel transport system permease protein